LEVVDLEDLELEVG
jgi:hypothetical protein